MADLFKEILPSILQTKKAFMLTEQDEKSFPAFIVGRALSQFPDTVFYANAVNYYPSMDNKMKADFLLNTVKPYKRPFSKWAKKVETVDLAVVKEYYGYSDAKALEALAILTPAQINSLKLELEKGE
jgi:Bacteriophage clamp loader A subunit